MMTPDTEKRLLDDNEDEKFFERYKQKYGEEWEDAVRAEVNELTGAR